MTGAAAPSGTPEPSAATTAASADGEWRTLSVRVIWVDLAQSVLSLVPAAIAFGVLGIDPTLSAMWPFAAIAAWGVIGAAADAVRWLVTRYRITEGEIERRTGLLVRRQRSVRRDRVRSVDTHAKLRHRIAGLRVVTIGAGQQSTSGEAAFVLDSLAREDAELLRRVLLRERSTEGTPVVDPAMAGEALELESADEPGDVAVLATLRPSWVLFNMVSVWAYLMAAGLLWGAFWLAQTFGVNLVEVSARFVAWDSLGWSGIALIALVGAGALGAIGMGVNFFATNWGFELARVRSEAGTFLRTRKGLLSTREVNRDEARMRGLSIGEPLLWRWMGMADTNVITTGLGLWDASEPTAILPRGPKRVALVVAARVLGEPSPIDAPLRRHPRTALRRRLWWGSLVAAGAVGLVALPVATGAAPMWVLGSAVGVWPVALGAAVVSYRALGHTIAGDHLVVRSGLMRRTVAALRRDAVSTIAVRQSILQKRLGLSTVSAMTAAGWSVYEAKDVASDEALPFALQAAPGLAREFLDRPDALATPRES